MHLRSEDDGNGQRWDPPELDRRILLQIRPGRLESHMSPADEQPIRLKFLYESPSTFYVTLSGSVRGAYGDEALSYDWTGGKIA